MDIQFYPLFRRSLRFSLPPINAPVHEFDGEHYWELGKKGYPLSRGMAIFHGLHLTVKKHYRVKEKPLNHLFILEHGKQPIET